MASRRDDALQRMRDAVALWYVDQGSAADIVYAACDLLVAGLDGPEIAMLAGASVARADVEVPALLEPALREIGIPFLRKDSAEAQRVGLVAMAFRVLSGDLDPHVLTARAYAIWVAEEDDETGDLVESLAQLECEYDVAQALAYDIAGIDAAVIAEARWLAEPRPD